MKAISIRRLANGKIFHRVSEAALPTLRVIPNPRVGQYNRRTETIGVVLVRRLLKWQLDTLAAGGDPAGVSFDEDAPPVRFEAGNWLRDT